MKKTSLDKKVTVLTLAVLAAALPARAGGNVAAGAPASAARVVSAPSGPAFLASVGPAAAMLGLGMPAPTAGAEERAAAYASIVVSLAIRPNPAVEALVGQAVSLQAAAIGRARFQGDLDAEQLAAEAAELEPFLNLPATANQVKIVQGLAKAAAEGEKTLARARQAADLLQSPGQADAEGGLINLAAESLGTLRKTWDHDTATSMLRRVSDLARLHPSPRLHEAIARDLGATLRKTSDMRTVWGEIGLLAKMALPAQGFAPFLGTQEAVVDILALEASKTEDMRVFSWSLEQLRAIGAQDRTADLSVRTRVFRALVLERERLGKKWAVDLRVEKELNAAIASLATLGVPVSELEVLAQAAPAGAGASPRYSLPVGAAVAAQLGLLAATAGSVALALFLGVSSNAAVLLGALVLAAGSVAVVYLMIKGDAPRKNGTGGGVGSKIS